MTGGSSDSSGFQRSSSSALSSTAPWGPQAPGLRQLYGGAQGAARSELGFYPEQTYANFAPETQAGLRGFNRLGGSNPVTEQSLGYTSDVLGGKYMDRNRNPYLDDYADQAMRSVTRNYQTAVEPGIASQFELAGRGTGGSAMNARGVAQDQLARGLREMGTSIYMGSYEQERGRMENAAGRSPELYSSLYGSAGQMVNAGARREGQEQLGIDEGVARFEFGQREPYERMGLLQQLLGSPVMASRSAAESKSMGEQQSSAWNFGLF